MIAASSITGLVLAGGQGSRMGGLDKGLQPFHGVPLALHALRRLAPQVGPAMLNANRNLPAYAAFGVPVWPDAPQETDTAHFAGPLAGFLAGLSHCDTPYLLTVPCDVPFFPVDLATRLAAALEAHDADIAVAAAPQDGRLRPQPVFCLLKTRLRDSLAAFVRSGGRKPGLWFAQHKTQLTPFEMTTGQPVFANLNTLAELQSLQSGQG